MTDCTHPRTTKEEWWDGPVFHRTHTCKDCGVSTTFRQRNFAKRLWTALLYTRIGRSLKRRFHTRFGHRDRRYHEVISSSLAGHVLWCYDCGVEYDAPVR